MTEPARRATTIVKHSLAVAGHRTSISLEDAFWRGLGVIAARRRMTVPALVAAIDKDRGASNLSSAIRVFVLDDVSGNSPATAPDSDA